MSRFKAKTEQQKLLNKEQFKEVFLEYLIVLDEFDAELRNRMERVKSLRYLVDQSLEEHPDLAHSMYQEYEANKIFDRMEKKE